MKHFSSQLKEGPFIKGDQVTEDDEKKYENLKEYKENILEAGKIFPNVFKWFQLIDSAANKNIA